MHYFSGHYKKMCAKAEEIQKRWKDNIQDWDEYTPKGDYKDGHGWQVQVKIDDVDEIIENNIWLPLDYQIKERLFKSYGIKNLREKIEKECSSFITEYLKNKEKSKKIESCFGDNRTEIWNALTLMYWMRKYCQKIWDFDKEDWVKISAE